MTLVITEERSFIMFRKFSIVPLLWCIALFVCLGCEDKRRFTVTDHRGEIYKGMKIDDGGFGWSRFKDGHGRALVVRGEYSYIEEGNKQ